MNFFATAAVVSALFAPAGFAQILSVVSGDGQITLQSSTANNPLVVIAKDGAGRPMQGVTVNWSLNGTGHLVSGAQTTTDASGLTSASFVGDWDYGTTGFTQTTVVAAAGSSSVSMHVITSGFSLQTNGAYVRADVLTPTLADVVSGAGAAVDVQFTSTYLQGNLPVPGAAIRLIPDQGSGPSLACAEGTGISGANGVAHCVVVFSGSVGTGLFSIEVGGGFRTFGPFQFAVTQVQTAPAVIRILGGNNQAGLPGSPLPAPLTARVEDAAGHALSGVAVTWQPVAAQSVTLTNVVSTSDANGGISANVTLGSTVGSAQVQVRTSNNAQAVFNFTIRQPATGGGGSGGAQPFTIRIIGGNNQSGAVGTRLSASLVARVEDSSGNPIPNVPVTWKPSPSVTLSNQVSTSDSSGQVSTLATPIASTAPVQVEVQAQGSVPTPFGNAATTVSVVFTISVGGGSQPAPGSGPPASIRILSGNNQAGPVGSRLAAALTARVEDSSGNPLPNVTVTWKPSASITLSSIVSTSDSGGVVSAVATPNSAAAPLTVDVQAQGVSQTPFGPANVPITATFNISIGAGSPAPGGAIPSSSAGYIPHIADGAEWKTTITVVNLLSVPQKVTLTFWAANGSKWSLPVAGGGASEQASFDLQPNASAQLETAGTAALVTSGWATVEGSVSGSSGVGASAIFRSHVAGRQDSEAVSAMNVVSPKGVIFPFDNRNGFATGVAIVNVGSAGVVPITIRDSVGTPLITDSIAFGSATHISFSLTDRYPALAGRVGTVEIGSATASVLGLRFNPSGSFTSVPPSSKP